MNRSAWTAGIIVFAITAGAAAFLATQQSRQRLGPPGVRVETNAPQYSIEAGASTNAPKVFTNQRVYLPPQVLDFQGLPWPNWPASVPDPGAQPWPIPSTTVGALPADTLYGRRMYAQSNGPAVECNVVLMGTDRSSIHKPQYCLNGNGLTIVAEELATVRVGGAHAYDLPVMKLKLRWQTQNPDGTPRLVSGVFVYWFVADGELTASHTDRMWWMARDMLQTGVLQRWAYVTCLSWCAPGGEDVTFARLQEFIAAAAPEIQPGAGAVQTAAK